MTLKRSSNLSDAGDSAEFGGADINKVMDLLDNGVNIDTINIDSNINLKNGKATITNPLLDSYTDLARISAPSNPSTNRGRLYVKQTDTNNDGLFCLLKRGGSFVEVQII